MATKRRSGLLVGVLLLLAALLGGAVWLVLSSGGDAADDGPPAERREHVAPRAEPPPDRAGATTPRERVAAHPDGSTTTVIEPDTETRREAPGPSPVAPTRTVNVTVVHEGGVPVRDAHVRAFSIFGDVDVDPPDPVTDVEGRATLRIAGVSGFQLRAWTRDSAALGERVAAGPDEVLEVTLTLQPGRAVTGRVVSDVSTPIEDADVALRLPTGDPFGLRVTARSDHDGRFDLGGVPAALLDAAETRVLAAARGFLRRTARIEDVGTGGELLLRLERGLTVRGRCVAVGAAPVSGVRVDAGGVEQVSTGRDGRFELEGASPEGVVLELTPSQHVVPPPLLIPALTGEHDIGDVLLVEGRPVAGYVVDDGENPVPGATVEILEQERSRVVRTVQADGKGRFTAPHIGEGPHTVTATANAGAEWSSRLSGRVADVAAGTTGLRVVLTGGLTLLVEFKRDGDREPVGVASAEVEVTRTDVDVGRTVSAWAGPGMTSVRVSFDAPGRYRVVVKVPGYEPATVEDVEILGDRATRIDALFRRLPE